MSFSPSPTRRGAAARLEALSPTPLSSPAAEKVAVFEYWAGNPSVEIHHGHLVVAGASAASSSNSGPRAGSAAASCVALASSVPCHMSAPELCDFLGAFGAETHRRFRHCRVLHGKNTEEYMVALLMASPAEAASLIENFDCKRYNALEAGQCRLHRVLQSRHGAPSPSPSTGSELEGEPSRRARGSGAGGGAPPPGVSEEQGSPPAHLARRRSPVHFPPGFGSPAHGPSQQLHHPQPQALSQAFASQVAPLTPMMLPSPGPETCMSPSTSPPLPSAMAELRRVELDPSELDLFDSKMGQSVMSPPPTASCGNERAFCAVCLESIDPNPAGYQLSEMGGGVPLTILCGHTFHARCLARWCDASCPVCRFQQHPVQVSSCDVCGQSEGVHICLVCGFIGCSFQGAGHAQQHFEATSHAYALDVNTQRVWDYAGNGHVHRLLFNEEDGKMVEHTVPVPLTPGGEGELGAEGAIGSPEASSELGGAPVRLFGDFEASDDAKVSGEARRARLSTLARPSPTLSGAAGSAKKQEGIVSEFNHLLSSQMTEQRFHFDARRKELDLEHCRQLQELEGQHRAATAAADEVQRRLDELRAEAPRLQAAVAAATAADEVARRQKVQLELLNSRISAEQVLFEEKLGLGNKEERRKAARLQRDRSVAELQQEIKDLELFLQMRRRCEASADAAELQGAHLLVTEGTASRGRGGRGRRTSRR